MGKRKSSSKAFLDLLEPLGDSLYRYAKRMAWDDDLVADIVQEAVMTGWREFGRFERNTNFKAWMFKILINTIYRLNKRAARQRVATLDESNPDSSLMLERENTWASLLENPERLMQLLDERLVHALDRLATDERQCLLLRILEGFSYKEIASMMEIPLGTVMSHVHRARAKLRERLAALALEHGFITRASE
ncbi:MAG: sigma-70 family RNA polymerase sigma factor [Phycisphaerales bacterium]|nr:sigma-70 family RNA polymerase sigma factor [Phycisphaerales bacterium]